MTQNQLNQAVASATGESLREIGRRGFGLADPVDDEFDPEADCLPPQFVDWDALDVSRMALFP